MTSHALPGIVVTGASGFIGRNVVASLCENFHVYALARRPQQEVGVSRHQNIEWILVDIADAARLGHMFREILAQGGADYVIHLAGYYDFSYDDHPEYEPMFTGLKMFSTPAGCSIPSVLFLHPHSSCQRFRKTVRF